MNHDERFDYEVKIRDRLRAQPEILEEVRGETGDPRIWASELPDEEAWTPRAITVALEEMSSLFTVGSADHPGSLDEVTGTIVIGVAVSRKQPPTEAPRGPRAKCWEIARLVLKAMTQRWPDDDPACFQIRTLSAAGPRLDEEARIWIAPVRVGFAAFEEEFPEPEEETDGPAR